MEDKMENDINNQHDIKKQLHIPLLGQHNEQFLSISDNEDTFCQKIYIWLLHFSKKIFSLFTLNLLLMIISGTSLMICMRITLSRNPYTYFVYQSGVLAYLPIVFTINIYFLYISKTVPDPARTKKAILSYSLMALLDGTEDLFQVFGGNLSTLALLSLLPQLVIPMTMFFSILIIKTRYSPLHYLGALLILGGVLLTIVPLFGQGPHGSMFGEFLLAASSIPGSLSALYKQYFLQKQQSHLIYMTTWVTLFQIIWGILISPLNSWKFWQNPPIPLSELPTQFYEGFLCTFTCEGVLLPWIVIKNSSASFTYIVTSLQLPLTNLISTSSYIMGDVSSPLSIYDVFALICMLIGLIFFAYQAEKQEIQLEKKVGKEEITLRRRQQTYFSRYSGLSSNLSSAWDAVKIEPVILRRTDSEGRRLQYLGSIGFNVSPRITPRRKSSRN